MAKRFTRRGLLAAAAPIAAVPIVEKLAFGQSAVGRRHDHSSHRHLAAATRRADGDEPRGDDRRRRAPAVGGPHDLDALLYPPPALPAEPGRVREYTLTAVDREIEIAPGVFFPAWTYNGTVPGPVLRATEGDMLRVRFLNAGSHPHTIHFHGIHPPNMDGVFEIVDAGRRARPTSSRRGPPGLHPYHCHSTPLKKHIHKGLYGVLIIDPAEPRPPAQELVMVMNGYDTDGDGEQQLLHRQRPHVLLRAVPDPGQPLEAGAHLPGEPDRVRPDQLVPPARRLLPLPADRHGRRTGSTPTSSCSARASAA